MNRFEELLTALINGEDIGDWVPLSRLEEYLVRCCKREKADDIIPLTRTEVLLEQLAATIAEGGSGDDDSALPIEVSTESEMNELLTNGEIGGIYKYIGETTETYTNGELYILEEAESYYLTFTSNSPFSLTSSYGYFQNDGIIQYSIDAINWNNVDFNSDTINSSDAGVLYLRGIGNTVITGIDEDNGDSDMFVFNADDYIYCSGNIETLLDYETVMRGEHPPMGDYCFARLFAGNTNLITAPELPATTLADYCYVSMFNGCTNIKLSAVQTDEYQNVYRIPSSGDGIDAEDALYDMFTDTGGTFTETPTINTTYYTSNKSV